MLAGGLDGLYRKILRGPHAILTRVEVWSGQERIDTYGDAGLPYGQGSVSATLTSRVARVLSLSLERSQFPTSPQGLLAPFGNYLKVYSGVVGYLFPVFYGRINDVTLSADGTVSLTAIDLAGDVQDCYFGHPTQSDPTSTLGHQFRVLVQDAVPFATFGDFDENANISTPTLTWENDRASACDSLAQQGNLFWYPLADGDFVMRTVAWTTNADPLLTFTDGEGGTLLNWSVSYSRTGVSNSVLVSGELADGSTPVYGTAQDNNPASPTYINGNFGVKTRFVSVQGTQTAGSAQTLANTYLRQAKAITETWVAQIPSDAALELGDAILLSGRGRQSSPTQVVSGFTLSLDSHDTMNVTLRAQVPSQQSLPDD